MHSVQVLHRTEAHLISQEVGLVKQNSGQLESVDDAVGSPVGSEVGESEGFVGCKVGC